MDAAPSSSFIIDDCVELVIYWRSTIVSRLIKLANRFSSWPWRPLISHSCYKSVSRGVSGLRWIIVPYLFLTHHRWLYVNEDIS
jgi:hypothetical protein